MVQRPCRLRKWMSVSKVRLHQGPVLLRPHPQVYDPLVAPGGFERSRSHFRDRPRSVWPSKGAEAVFRQRADIGVTRVQRCANPREHEEGDKVSLMEHIHMGIRGEVSTLPDEPVRWVILQLLTRREAVLDALVVADRGQVVGPAFAYGEKPLQLLAEGLRTEKRRLEHELRDVRPLDVTVARVELPAEQILRCDRVRVFVLTALDV